MHLSSGEKKKITLKARCYYGNPDIVLSVQEGEVYTFIADENQKWTDLIVTRNAEGFKNPFVPKHKRRVSEAKVFELCGTIDENEQNHFRIGLKRENFSIPKTGKLHFFANDHKNEFWYIINNWGKMKVEVTRIS